MSSDFDPNGLVNIFILEATEGLTTLSEALQPRNGVSPTPESLRDLYIVAHRLKGAASQYGFQEIAKTVETLETLLEPIAEEPQENWPAVLSRLRALVAHLEAQLEAAGPPGPSEPHAEPHAEPHDRHQAPLSLVPEDPPDRAAIGHPTTSEQFSNDYLFPAVDAEVMSYFAPEAQEYINTIEETVLHLERNPTNQETIQELFRTTHTLKGSAYTVGFQVIGDVVHPLEDFMGAVMEGRLRVTKEALDLFLLAIDVIRMLIRRNPGEAEHVRSKLVTVMQDLRQMNQSTEAGIRQGTARTRTLADADEVPVEPSGQPPPEKTWSDTYLLPDLKSHVLSCFTTEAEGCISTIDASLHRLEKSPRNRKAMRDLLASLQLLKGAAYSAGFLAIGQLNEQAEEVLAATMGGRSPIESGLSGLLFRLIDVNRQLLRRDSSNLDQTREDFAAVLDGLRQISLTTAVEATESPAEEHPQAEGATGQAAPQDQPTESRTKDETGVIRVSRERLERLLNLVGELVIGRNRLDRRLTDLQQLTKQVMTYRNRMMETVWEFEDKHEFTLPTHPSASNDWTSDEEAALTEFGSLEFDRYDDVNVLSRRIAEVATDVSESMTLLNGSIRESREDMSQLHRLTTSIRDEIAHARMVPIGTPFLRFRRAVREMARVTGKEVSLVTSGEHTEADTMVVDRLIDPLIHLVRNAVYHGIEPEASRVAKGKPPGGTIFLRADHRGNRVVIEIEDDGAGLDLERIKDRAVAMRAITQETAETLTEAQSAELIFLPSLSTADSVDGQAGRGIGMDVVKCAIEGMNGSIQVETRKGVGTKFTLAISLTLLVTTALIVRVGQQQYAFPLPSVQEVILPLPDDLHQVGGRTILRIEEEVIDIQSLAGILKGAPGPVGNALPIVVSKTPVGAMGFVVDELLGRHEIVIKSLGTLTPLQHSYFGGGSIDPEGRVILVLDVARLAAATQGGKLGASAATHAPLLSHEPRGEFAPTYQRESEEEGSKILLIDDSLSIRKFVGRMLEKAGYVVDTAVDGEDGLKRAAASPYKLIITDLEMPKVNGYEVLQALRNRQQTQATPVIVLTTRVGEKHRQVALSRGASGFIAKPVEERTLLQEISHWVGPPIGARR